MIREHRLGVMGGIVRESISECVGTNGQADSAPFDQAGLERLAQALLPSLRAGQAVLLHGPLGAGKSTFCRALIRAAAANPMLEVPSPTYTLVQSYETSRFMLHHFDLWRLSGPDGLEDLGWDDARSGVVLVEWPDRLGALVPDDALHITFGIAGDGLRHVHFDDLRR
jgi:tRNA threonylcarbamoyladenosine biosynthesis protein TsaE